MTSIYEHQNSLIYIKNPTEKQTSYQYYSSVLTLPLCQRVAGNELTLILLMTPPQHSPPYASQLTNKFIDSGMIEISFCTEYVQASSVVRANLFHQTIAAHFCLQTTTQNHNQHGNKSAGVINTRHTRNAESACVLELLYLTCLI